MLVDIFKPGWKSSSVEKRRKAIAGLDSDNIDQQKTLLQLAADDADNSVRMAAMQQLTSIAALHELSIKLNGNDVARDVEKRVNELLAIHHAMDEEQYSNLLKRYPELQIRIAAHADSSTIRTTAIKTLSDTQLLDVLEATVYTDSRQLIADKLSSIEQLESARKILRGKDKSAERIIKTRIESIRAHQKQLAENSACVEKLTEEVEYLATHDWLPEFRVRCMAHRDQWDSLTFDIDDDARKRYQKAREVVDSRFEQQRLIDQTQESQNSLVNQLTELLQVTATRDLTASIETLNETETQQQKLAADWLVLSEITAPDSKLLNQYNKTLDVWLKSTQLIARFAELKPDSTEDSNQAEKDDAESKYNQQVHTLLKHLKWPSGFTELQLVKELKQQLKEWREAQQAAIEIHEQKLSKVHKNISAIFRFSQSGNLGRAKQIAQKVEKAISKFDGKDQSALQERFEEASKSLGNMDDWKNFATEPKYLELCEAMELLTTSKLHADKLSTELKALQQQWKALGHSEISDQYWTRFKTAADQVYNTCSTFFEQRHQRHKANLEKRQQYVDQLQKLLETTDWDNSPDYKAVQSDVRSISERFSRIKDVDRQAGQKQWKQFSTSRDAVNAKLDIAYDANITLKQQLIDQTEALANATPKDENLAALKTLQIRWKKIGVTRREQDQKAWKAFKKHGDLVYNRVQELRQQHRTETDQQLQAYRDIIKAIQQLAKTASNLNEADQQFTTLQASFAELPELPSQLPEKLIDGIQRDYLKACDQYDNSHTQIIKNQYRKQLDALRKKAELCGLQEALGVSPDESELQKITEQWDLIELSNIELMRRIEARRNTAQTDIDRTAVTAERRMMCIQLEITMGVDSPSEDKALRMQYQLQQMNQSGLGQQLDNGTDRLEEMELEWLCMPGAESQQQKLLDERFQSVLRSN